MENTDRNEFRKYAVKHHRINSLQVDKYLANFDRSRMPSGIATTVPTGMTPYIIEERQLNISQLDVFSRLMMDRIIFLGDAFMKASRILSRHNCCSCNRLMLNAISRSTLTRRVVPFMPV